MRAFSRHVALFAITLTLWLPGFSAENASAWRGVKRVRGAYTVTSESWERNEPRSSSYEKQTATMNFVLVWQDNLIPPANPGIPPEMLELLVSSGQLSAAQFAKMKAELDNIAPGPAALVFRRESAVATGSIRKQGTLKEFSSDKGWSVKSSSSSEASFSGEPSDKPSDFDFHLYPGTGEWSITLPSEMREEYTIRAQGYNDGKAWTSESRKRGILEDYFRGKVSGPLLPITASYSREEINKTDPKRGSRKVAKLELWPEAHDVALELTIPGYEQWRPRATVDIHKLFVPGNHLVVRATLVPKGGRVEDLPHITSLKFELLGTSREPGICMNWPMDMEDDDLFDIKLEELPQFSGFLNEHKQTNQVTKMAKDAEGRPYGESRINSFDFGGRSTLTVTCVLSDGRQLVGTLKTPTGEMSQVRLPYMKKPGWIAEHWRQENKVAALADDHDEEKVDGQQHNGDGYTLYEEYRGWVVNGRHVEGDPKRKDFFVRLNQVGLALPGVAKFQRITKLRVHSSLAAEEFPASRVMNANRAQGPHRTKQHGILVQVDPNRRGSAAARGGPGNPKKITSVDLMSNIAAFDATWIAATVAHELGHCVNIWHHGGGDSTVVWFAANGGLFERPSNVAAGGRAIVVMNEQYTNLTPAIIAAAEAGQITYTMEMGSDQGQHSGFENCVMRYDCAQTYVYRARNDVRVYGFQEPVGGAICTATAGTGVNAAARVPQSRYGAAQQNRGGCFHQILVSDAVDAPPR